MSLSLCGLKTCVVSVMAVSHLYLTGTGNGKSLSGCLMCLDFSHFYNLLLIFQFLSRLCRIYHIWRLTAFMNLFELDGGYYHAHDPAVEYGSLIYGSYLFTSLTEFGHDLLSDSDVTHLTSLKTH